MFSVVIADPVDIFFGSCLVELATMVEKCRELKYGKKCRNEKNVLLPDIACLRLWQQIIAVLCGW